MLQFITNTESKTPVIDQILGVLDGGCKWIQIRMKDASDDEIKNVYNAIKEKCAEKDAFIIINDRVELAKELEATGVHLGKMDMLPSQARIMLGPAAVIGVTANSIEDIIAVRSLDVDYVGVGPFAQTSTKKNLAPILGLSGLEKVNKEMAEKNIELAHVAVGGITLDDIVPIMNIGYNGIAVSGAIANSDNIPNETRKFLKILDELNSMKK